MKVQKETQPCLKSVSGLGLSTQEPHSSGARQRTMKAILKACYLEGPTTRIVVGSWTLKVVTQRVHIHYH